MNGCGVSEPSERSEKTKLPDIYLAMHQALDAFDPNRGVSFEERQKKIKIAEDLAESYRGPITGKFHQDYNKFAKFVMSLIADSQQFSHEIMEFSLELEKTAEEL
ncbi:MAG: hypothetical protein Q8Q06_04135 [bacterium]|nr:hypothetical protein [bacterium]